MVALPLQSLEPQVVANYASTVRLGLVRDISDISASLKLPNETKLKIINDVYPDNILNMPNPKALAKVSEVCLHGPVLEDWPEYVKSLEILTDLTSLPSVKSLEGKLFAMDPFFGRPSRLYLRCLRPTLNIA